MAGSHTGDNGSLEDNAWNWWPVRSTLVVYGQVLVAFGQSRLVYGQVWSTVNVGHEAEVAVSVLGTGKD